MVEPTIRVTKKFSITLGVAASPLPVTVAMLSASIPGGLTYWSRVRFEKFDVWSGSPDEAAKLSITVGPDASSAQPPFQITDHGTSGQRRSAVGFKLGLLERARFFGTADTTALFTVLAPAGPGVQVFVHTTIELISPALASPSLEAPVTTLA